MQPDDFAAAVVTLVKNALAPMAERLAAAETRLAALDGVRDRVVSLETKSAVVVVSPGPAVVDLTPLLERQAATDARLGTLGDLRDRVVVLETKAAQPVPDPAADVATFIERLTALELTAMKPDALLSAYVADLMKEAAGLRERIAVAEVRPLLVGPAGKDGADGLHGKDGAPGVDGLGFDDLAVVQQDDRSFTIKAFRGDKSKDIGTVTHKAMIQRGVYLDGKSYETGDVVTWGGSMWHANEPTSMKPGEGSKAWTLVVKRGRDGKDGQDAPGALPVVKIR